MWLPLPGPTAEPRALARSRRGITSGHGHRRAPSASGRSSTTWPRPSTSSGSRSRASARPSSRTSPSTPPTVSRPTSIDPCSARMGAAAPARTRSSRGASDSPVTPQAAVGRTDSQGVKELVQKMAAALADADRRIAELQTMLPIEFGDAELRAGLKISETRELLQAVPARPPCSCAGSGVSCRRARPPRVPRHAREWSPCGSPCRRQKCPQVEVAELGHRAAGLPLAVLADGDDDAVSCGDDLLRLDRDVRPGLEEAAGIAGNSVEDEEGHHRHPVPPGPPRRRTPRPLPPVPPSGPSRRPRQSAGSPARSSSSGSPRR